MDNWIIALGVSILGIAIPAAVTLTINYFQRRRNAKNDNATLSEKYQLIANTEADKRVELEGRIERLEAQVNEIATDRARWKKLALQYKKERDEWKRRYEEEFKVYEQRINDLEREINNIKNGTTWD